MPKEHKKRGRRGEQKRKREDEEVEEKLNEEIKLDRPVKRQRSQEAEGQADVEGEQAGYYAIEDEQQDEGFYDADQQIEYDEGPTRPEHEFYGMLTEDEQAYFKNADNMLELNQFADPEERGIFLDSVWREASSKELKIANSQSCSRFLERLLRQSTPAQKKSLFMKLKGHFLSLVQHRFASHVCEALFLQAAPIVTDELIAPDETEAEDGEQLPSMEDLFLAAVEELEENMGYLVTDNFASHTLRVLLVVLSGHPLDDVATSVVLKSRKKENVAGSNAGARKDGNTASSRSVPDSFDSALSRMTASAVGTLDTNYLRALATQPVANPVLQLLLEIEFGRSGKQKAKDEKSLYRRLLPDEVPDEGTQSSTFVKGLLYDPVGSRLLETIMKNAPGKAFKTIYNIHFRGNLKNIVRNDVASFVGMRVFERLSKDNLLEALDELSPVVPDLLAKSKTTVIKTLIDQSRFRGVDVKQLAKAIEDALGPPGSEALLKLLQPPTSHGDGVSPERKPEIEAHDSSKRHASLLGQAMVAGSDSLQKYIFDCMLNMDGPTLFELSNDKSATHLVQAALKSDDVAFRRKLIPKIQGHIGQLATETIGSHVVDALWDATERSQFVRERVADELLSHEETIRATFPGQKVWRNWMLDLYKRDKRSWVARSKAAAADMQSYEPQSSARYQQGGGKKPIEVAREGNGAKKQKSAIELARERHAAKKGGPQGRPLVRA